MPMGSDTRTFRLFARLDAISGAARLVDIFGNLNLCNRYNRHRPDYDPTRIDAEAIASDWAAIGMDMWKAIERYEQEQAGAKPAK